MLHLVFTETALETVPRELWRYPSVVSTARQREKKPGEILLDRALHHSAMSRISDSFRRGRPDIIHLCLLEALGTPLNRGGLLRVFIHTYGGMALAVSPQVRLPRNYNRFVGLMEQLFSEGQIPPGKESLLKTESRSLQDILGEIEPTRVLALTSHGELTDLRELCPKLAREKRPVVFVGAYPHGPMNEEVLKLADESASIYPESLDACIVASRLIYQYELASKENL